MSLLVKKMSVVSSILLVVLVIGFPSMEQSYTSQMIPPNSNSVVTLPGEEFPYLDLDGLGGCSNSDDISGYLTSSPESVYYCSANSEVKQLSCCKNGEEFFYHATAKAVCKATWFGQTKTFTQPCGYTICSFDDHSARCQEIDKLCEDGVRAKYDEGTRIKRRICESNL